MPQELYKITLPSGALATFDNEWLRIYGVNQSLYAKIPRADTKVIKEFLMDLV